MIELAPSTGSTVRWVTKLLTNLELADGRRFGDIRLSRLTWQDIEAAYAAIKARGGEVAYVRRSATILSLALDLARKRGLIDTNPAKDAARPRTVRSKPHSPNIDEVRAASLAAEKRDEEACDLAVVVASSGMRKGEVLALRWCDLDLDKSEVHVAAAVSDGGPGVGLVRKSTKTSDCPGRPADRGRAEMALGMSRTPQPDLGQKLPTKVLLGPREIWLT